MINVNLWLSFLGGRQLWAGGTDLVRKWIVPCLFLFLARAKNEQIRIGDIELFGTKTSTSRRLKRRIAIETTTGCSRRQHNHSFTLAKTTIGTIQIFDLLKIR